MIQLGYDIDEQGNIIKYGYYDNCNFECDGSEPFSALNYDMFKRINGSFEPQPYIFYKYFLIPSDMVPQISVYSDFVKEALFHLAFNVHINDINTIVEGIEYKSPLYINFIPCSCTRWTDEGLLLLDAVVENWNHSNPLKQITFSVKFESYNEFIEFRNSKKI